MLSYKKTRTALCWPSVVNTFNSIIGRLIPVLFTTDVWPTDLHGTCQGLVLAGALYQDYKIDVKIEELFGKDHKN